MKSNKRSKEAKQSCVLASWQNQIIICAILFSTSCQRSEQVKLIDFLVRDEVKSPYTVVLSSKIPAEEGKFIESIQKLTYTVSGDTLNIFKESKIDGIIGSTEVIQAKFSDRVLSLIKRDFKGFKNHSQNGGADLIVCSQDQTTKTWKYDKYGETQDCNSRIIDTTINSKLKSVLIVEEIVTTIEDSQNEEYVERTFFVKGEGIFKIENFSIGNPDERLVWVEQSAKNQEPNVRNDENQITLVRLEKGKNEKIIDVTLNPKSKKHFKIYVEKDQYFLTEGMNCDEFEDSYLVALSPINFEGMDGECGLIETLTKKKGYHEFYLMNESKTRKVIKFRIHIGPASEYFAEYPEKK